jgi:hypothetical protein
MMISHRLLSISLLSVLCLPAAAQTPPPPTPPEGGQPGSEPGDGGRLPSPAREGEQDPAPPPVPARERTAEERLAELQASLESARREKQYLAEVLKSGGLVERFKRQRAYAREMDEMARKAGAAGAKGTRKRARLLGDAEKDRLSEHVVFTVDEMPVTQAEFDQMLDYLRSYPRPDGTSDVKSDAILALVRTKAAQAAAKDSAEQARMALEKVAVELAGGADFAALAEQHSDDKDSAAQGGKRADLTREDADKCYARAAFGLGIGQVSGVVATPAGYHIIKLRGKKKGSSPDQDQIMTSHILKCYSSDRTQAEALEARLAAGDVDLAFRSDDLRKFVPAPFK